LRGASLRKESMKLMLTLPIVGKSALPSFLLVALALAMPGFSAAMQPVKASHSAEKAAGQPSPLLIESVVIEQAKEGETLTIASSERDAREIREATEKELAALAAASLENADNPLKIWILIRRYRWAVGDNGSSALASVAWCVALDAEHILFQEEFYAANHASLKGAKGSVNKAIALRVAASVRKLAPLGGANDSKLVSIKNTYVKYSDAEEVAGKLLTRNVIGYDNSMGSRRQISDTTYVTGWDWAQHPGHINWQQYISRLSAGKN
jgi:hypothetical protein